MRHTPALHTIVRRGFTLVELLVAAALCVLVMYILAEAFRAGTDTLSQLKSVAGLADQLRVAETIIRHDLKQQHLEDKDGNPVQVSDRRFDPNNQLNNQQLSWEAPNRGFFKIVQRSQGTSEQSDGNGIPSLRATDHWIQFTSKLSGRSAQDIFVSPAPTGTNGTVADHNTNLVDFATISGGTTTYASQWAEITYFLSASPTQMPEEASTVPGGSQPLFVLCRRARLLAPPQTGTGSIVVNPSTNVVSPVGGFPNLSGFQQTSTTSGTDWVMNTPDNISDPQFRTVKNPIIFPATPKKPSASSKTSSIASLLEPPDRIASTNTNNHGSDILLSNVVSMRIQVLDGISTSSKFLNYENPVPQVAPTPDTRWPAVWDTYLTNDTPARILGVRVQLRVYDGRNMITRQVTIDQPL